ncbi:MAG: IS21-like element helper ATPase IstB [Epsilonproteobacteria bacterium]|nr:IS21-like element helper ATPase IstB [Campylobacterota bacterium]
MSDLHKKLSKQFQSLMLKGLINCYQELATQAGVKKLQYEEYLSLLLDEEIKRKNESSVKTKIIKAKFPFVKTIEGFDFSFQPNLNEKEVISLSSLDFITKGENVIFLGPPGVGKTHLAIGLGVKACMAKFRVIFTSTQKLIEELMLAVKDGSITDKLLSYSRLNLLIIDELGYMPIDKEQANLLFQLISIRYEKGAIILTSNYNFEDWGCVFQDSVVAAAIIDRLIHHAKIFYINGESYRLKNKLKK